MKLPNKTNNEMMEVITIGMSNIHHSSKALAKDHKDKHKTTISIYNNN